MNAVVPLQYARHALTVYVLLKVDNLIAHSDVKTAAAAKPPPPLV
jgi:hypothetical protein